MPKLDVVNRSDSFVGDSDTDGGSSYTPLCLSCKNKIDLYTCNAFLKGIPIGIIVGDIDHSTPINGDSGICYES